MKTMDVICYDFVPQLLSILQNKKMMSANNLVLDPNNPLAMYQPHDNRLGEALSGSVYQDMYHRLVSNPSKQLLCPLICYTDGTQIDSLSRFGVEPFLFMPAVLSHAACCKVDAWWPLGYVQQLRGNLQSDKRKLSTSAKARNYHAQLQAMLKSLQCVQTGADSRLQNVEIYLFDRCVQVDLLCPILLIAVDTPAADKLCGHYSSYTEGVQHMTCSCDVSFIDLDDPNFTCQPVTWDAMHCIQLPLLEVRKNVQQCPNTIVTMHFPTLKLVTLCTRYLVPCQQIQCIRCAKVSWLELCHWSLSAWRPLKSTGWMNWHRAFIKATDNLHARTFHRQTLAMVWLICPTWLPVRSVVLCFCWFV